MSKRTSSASPPNGSIEFKLIAIGATAMMSDLRPYTGVRILDLTHDLGRYAPRLFADLGADVIRVEPPEGLPDRIRISNGAHTERFGFDFLNAGKRSIVVDLSLESGRTSFAHLMKETQIVFLEYGAPLAYELSWVRSLNPAAVVTLISPYGLGGPLENAQAGDLVLQAAGGIAWLSGRPKEPPLRLPFNQSTMITSVYAAVASAIALVDSESSGHGHVIDVSSQECIAHSLQNALQVFDLTRRVSHRGGEGTQDASEGVFACKDGNVFAAMGLGTGRSWVNFCTWTREAGHACASEFALERWSNAPWRHTGEAMRLFRLHFESFIADYTIEKIMKETLERGLLIAPVNRVSDLFNDPQLAFRQFFIQLTNPESAGSITFPGAPYKMSVPVWHTSPAPALGQDNERVFR
jgi:benzylsuccinate CoA-transferase BbsE subunit